MAPAAGALRIAEETVVTELVLGLQVVIAIMCLSMKKPIAAVILLAVFSLLSALLFYHLDAPDVALTEAAVGAGITALVFVWVIHKTRGGDHHE